MATSGSPLQNMLNPGGPDQSLADRVKTAIKKQHGAQQRRESDFLGASEQANCRRNISAAHFTELADMVSKRDWGRHAIEDCPTKIQEAKGLLSSFSIVNSDSTSAIRRLKGDLAVNSSMSQGQRQCLHNALHVALGDTYGGPNPDLDLDLDRLYLLQQLRDMEEIEHQNIQGCVCSDRPAAEVIRKLSTDNACCEAAAGMNEDDSQKEWLKCALEVSGADKNEISTVVGQYGTLVSTMKPIFNGLEASQGGLFYAVMAIFILAVYYTLKGLLRDPDSPLEGSARKIINKDEIEQAAMRAAAVKRNSFTFRTSGSQAGQAGQAAPAPV